MIENTGLRKTGLVVGIAVLISGVISILAGIPDFGFPVHGPPVGMETVLRVKLFVTTLTGIVLLALLWNYASVYRDMPNRFTLSLLLFTVALLLYAVSSNPLLPLLLGFSHGATLGPFVFLPDIFASVAAIVLLYQSF